jgi:nitroreductase
MDLFDAIRTTWAVRRFSTEPVTDDEILVCLDAATRGPSGGNVQPWQFLVVRDDEAKSRIAEIYHRAYLRYERALLAVRRPLPDPADEASFLRMVGSARYLAEHLSSARAYVLVLLPQLGLTLKDEQGELDIGTPYASVYPAVQNFMLAARGLGIGCTLTTVYRIYQAEVRAAAAIPDRFEIVALLPLGRPAKGFGVGRRRAVAAVTHWDRFGNRRQSPEG